MPPSDAIFYLITYRATVSHHTLGKGFFLWICQ